MVIENPRMVARKVGSCVRRRLKPNMLPICAKVVPQTGRLVMMPLQGVRVGCREKMKWE